MQEDHSLWRPRKRVEKDAQGKNPEGHGHHDFPSKTISEIPGEQSGGHHDALRAQHGGRHHLVGAAQLFYVERGERKDGRVGEMKQKNAGDHGQHVAVREKRFPVGRRLAGPGKAARGVLVKIAGADEEDNSGGEQGRGGYGIEDGRFAEQRNQAHGHERGGNVAGVVPALIGAHGERKPGVADEREGQRAENGTEKRLHDAGEGQQGDGPEVRTDERGNQGEAQSGNDAGGGKEQAAVRDAIGEHAGGSLEEEGANSGGGGGEADGVVAPASFVEKGAEDRENDANHFGLEEVGGVKA